MKYIFFTISAQGLPFPILYYICLVGLYPSMINLVHSFETLYIYLYLSFYFSSIVCKIYIIKTLSIFLPFFSPYIEFFVFYFYILIYLYWLFYPLWAYTTLI
jgi:hypothetical protein